MMNETKDRKKRITISRTLFRWLLAVVVITFLASMVFTWFYQTKMSRDSAFSLLDINVEDVRQDVIDASDENLLKITREIAGEIDTRGSADKTALHRMLKSFDVAEINVVDENGIIIVTTNDEFQDYNMEDGKQSAEFMILLESGETEYVQSYQPTSFDPDLSRKYAAVVLSTGGFVQVGYDGERFRRDIDQYVINAAKNRHVGRGGCVIIANEDWNVVSDRYGNEGENLAVTGIQIDRETMPEGIVFHSLVYSEACSCIYIFSEGYYIIAVLPENEIILERNSSLRVMGIVEILLFLVLFLVIFLLVRKLIVKNLNKVNSSLSRITGGDLNEIVDVRSNAEFSDLSDDINSTVSTLKQYIAAAASRIDEELAFAKNIQESALPSVFPPYPDRMDFSIFAAMDTAKEVGGDFYDFYLLDPKRMAFLIADVSGKGIPAAMFMMTSKTVIRDYAERGDAPADVFINANEKLCEGNDSQMFLTAWMGFLETDTGTVHFVNAGHNPPVLIRKGKAAFIEQKANLMLAMMEGMRYKEQILELLPGDILYLYTDGVTEASAADESRFGNERLLSLLSTDFGSGDEACRKICETVRINIDAFAAGEPQFDDITQVCLYYAGNSFLCHTDTDKGRNSESLTVKAEVDHLYQVLSFVEERLENEGCGSKEKKQINMAVEEIFVNIASYAYSQDTGDVQITIETENNDSMVRIMISDSGLPYDPLKKTDPDLDMNIEDRQHGGFGIYMVKNMMDNVSYERKDGQNILTMEKKKSPYSCHFN